MNICARMRSRSRSRIFIFFFCAWCVIVQAANSNIFSDGEEAEAEAEAAGFVVSKESRRTLVSTENGEIVAARVAIGDGSSYHLLHFFTMDPNSLFLPVLLHSHMVFYVHTGSGKLSWTEENELQTTDLRQGDVYRLKEGAVFFIQSNLETTERRKLRINAIFANSNTEPPTPTGPYSSIRDLVLGFDNKVLQAAFKVSEEEIEELLKVAKPPAIIHGVSKSQKIAWEMETKFIGSRSYNLFQLNKKKGKGKTSVKLFNLFKEDKDFENGNGWSTAVTNKKLSVLQDADIGLFMVNLTTGSMMGPHWNPVATEIALVLQGRGMVRVVCSSGVSNDTGCKNMRFEVEEGDIFVVPRFHPMAQMAFNNETFVFMGFSTSVKKNHPQFLAGQASVLRTLSKQVLAMSFNVGNTTMDQLLASQQDSVILGCISCAEEELSILEEEREKTREREEERHRKEEEEEEAREREEEEAKRQEEERKRQEEEEEAEAERKRREEEEEEEERKQQEEEEEAEEAKREEQERKRQEEEEAAKRQEEERKRQEEEEEAEAERREEEEEEERKQQEEEEEAEEAKREEQERKRQEEEEAAKRQEQERKRHEEEEERRSRREEEAAARREKEKREEEAAAKREKEKRERREEAAERREAKEERRRHEEEMARREEEERQRQEAEEEEERQRQEEEHRQRKEEREEKHGRRRRRSEEEEAEEEERRREQEEEREEGERERRHKEE